MNQSHNPFVPKYAKDDKSFEYLGSDGLPIEVSYSIYLKKCDEFKFKARKYAKDNLSLKNSVLHNTKYGYESLEHLEEEVIQEREEHMNHYKKVFNISFFDEDENSMYNSFLGKSKKIRIIRELHEKRNEEFSDDVYKKTGCWFTRYCTLSRFIQAARKIILINRLGKALAILRTVTPEIIRNIENDAKKESVNSKKEEVYEE